MLFNVIFEDDLSDLRKQSHVNGSLLQTGGI